MISKFTSMAQVDAYTAGEKIQCLECDKWFAFLGNHLRRAHGLTNEEYRERYGLPAMTALAGQAYRRAHREKLQRMQADGTIDYSHLPAATAKAANADKPKNGVAKTAHAEMVSQLRPGDHHKIAPGGKRADGRDADHAREMQEVRRIVSPATGNPR